MTILKTRIFIIFFKVGGGITKNIKIQYTTFKIERIYIIFKQFQSLKNFRAVNHNPRSAGERKHARPVKCEANKTQYCNDSAQFQLKMQCANLELYEFTMLLMSFSYLLSGN